MKNLNLFQLNPDRIPDLDAFNADDFAPATSAEKEAVVERRQSVSYWRMRPGASRPTRSRWRRCSCFC